MDHFLYKDGVLHAEDVPLTEIAAQVGTPFYIYSTATLTRHFKLFQEALSGMDHLVCFAVKALSNVAVLRVLARLGAGMDVVSGGEYRRAKAAGVPGGADRVFRRWQNPRGNGAGADRRHSSDQRRIAGRTARSVRCGRKLGRDRAPSRCA